MSEDQKHWTQEDIDRMEEQVSKLKISIEQAKAYLRLEKVGYLDEYYKRELTGKVIMTEHPWPDGQSDYMYITYVNVEMERPKELDGVVGFTVG